RDLHHARELINAWRIDYNENRPHSAIGHLTPAKFAVTTKTERKEVKTT
ncbi:integrase core domain-containing protein, partial [Vibrio nigripulchritudo]